MSGRHSLQCTTRSCTPHSPLPSTKHLSPLLPMQLLERMPSLPTMQTEARECLASLLTLAIARGCEGNAKGRSGTSRTRQAHWPAVAATLAKLHDKLLVRECRALEVRDFGRDVVCGRGAMAEQPLDLSPVRVEARRGLEQAHISSRTWPN